MKRSSSELRTCANLDLPDLPFCANLPTLSDGFLICIKGQVWPNARKFTIQLLGSAKDVAISIDFVYNGDEVLVVRRCLINGRLKKEECDDFESTPKRSEVFEVILLVASSVFKCSINGVHVFNFPIYMKLDSMTSYNIFGNCDIARISHQLPRPVAKSRTSLPLQQANLPNHLQLPAFVPPQLPPAIGFLPSYSPPTGHSTSGDFCGESSFGAPAQLIFPNGIHPMKLIILYASTISTSKWFKVSFKSSSDPASDCAFVVYVDFSKAEVARNDFVSGIYGTRETRLPYFPFTPGDNFCIKFLCLPELFKMAVNESHLLEFHRRGIDLRDVRCVSVEGEVFISHLFES